MSRKDKANTIFPMPEQNGMNIVPNTVPSTPLEDSTSNRQMTRKLAAKNRPKHTSGAMFPRAVIDWFSGFTPMRYQESAAAHIRKRRPSYFGPNQP